MISLYRVCGVAALCAVLLGAVQSATAQGWGWGSDGDPSEGRRPPPPPPPPYGGSPYGGSPYSQGGGVGGYGQYGQPPRPQYGSANPRCRELEMQLSSGGTSASSPDQIPRLDNDIRQADYDYRRIQSDADRANCYDDSFLFGRSLRQSQRCIEIDRQVQFAKSKLGQLRAQREMLVRGSSPRGRRDEIVAELARNRCGENYAREYDQQRDRSSSIFSFFSNEDPDEAPAGHYNAPTYAASTFKTMCVRLCDGFYFPISYATSEDKFQDDAGKCQSQCAAPAELYYSRSDQEAEQMVSLSGKPYTSLPNAFRNRKVYIRGCSCNASEYSREEIAKSEETIRQQPQKQADARPISRPKAGASDSAAQRPAGAAAPSGAASAPAAPDDGPPPGTSQESPPTTTR